jgi:hypothetical protein
MTPAFLIYFEKKTKTPPQYNELSPHHSNRFKNAPHPGEAPAMKRRVSCYRCQHYYVTWDQDHPHGCRAMGFKSPILPAFNVVRESGNPCLLFTPKLKKKRKPKKRLV